MPDEPVPMLNKPKERTCETAEQFAENVLGRMSRAHGSFVDLGRTLAEPPEKARARFEKVREQAFAHFEKLTGLSFDRETGKCTTPGTVKMEGELRRQWAALCTQMREVPDAQKGEELLREVGKVLREAVQQGATGTIDGEEPRERIAD